MQKIYMGLALGLLLVACGKDKEDEDKKLARIPTESVAVVTHKLQSQHFEAWDEYSAELKGADDAWIITRVGGKLDRIATVGQRVAKGTSLCSIESERYGIFVAQSQAALDLAQSALQRIEADVNAGSLGKEALLKAKLDVETAKANLVNSKTNQQDNLCPAPFAGVVVSRAIDQYQFVAPGTQILRLARDDQFEAVISIPEVQRLGLKVGQKTEFFLISQPNQSFDGSIKELDLATDNRSRVFKAKVNIPNHGGTLKIGMIGRVRVLRQTFDQAVVIPSSAVLRFQNGNFAMVSKNGKAEERKLELGETMGDQVRVISGLQVGDELVVTGAFRLTQGTPITPQEK